MDNRHWCPPGRLPAGVKNVCAATELELLLRCLYPNSLPLPFSIPEYTYSCIRFTAFDKTHFNMWYSRTTEVGCVSARISVSCGNRVTLPPRVAANSFNESRYLFRGRKWLLLALFGLVYETVVPSKLTLGGVSCIRGCLESRVHVFCLDGDSRWITAGQPSPRLVSEIISQELSSGEGLSTFWRG